MGRISGDRRLLSWMLALLWLAGGAGADPAATVTMTNQLTFEPKTVTVTAGEQVRWRNTSLLVHTVTADPEQAAASEHVRLPEGADPFDSGRLEPDGVFSHRFQVPGRYRYFCVPHEGAGMMAEVVVRREH